VGYAIVAGVGMIPFTKPGSSEPYDVMGARAARLALDDAHLHYTDIGQAYTGYVYGDSSCGQAALYRLGMTGIPIINVNNNCSTGSTALYLARQAVESGMSDAVIAVGFEQMARGALQNVFCDRAAPLDRFVAAADEAQGPTEAPMAIRLFGGAGAEHQARYGTNTETFARIAAKARRHARFNDKAIFRDPITVEQVMASQAMFGPLTRLQCCPPTCGAAAAVVVSERFARERGIASPVRIRAQAMATDLPSTFETKSLMRIVGYDMTAAAARSVYQQSGIGPDDVDVVELHDCFTTNELLSYEGLGLCAEGGAEQFVVDEQNTYGGRVVTNPSGGLLSKGHPLGATGLAQCTELVHQLRGTAGQRQVAGARIGLQHNLGLGGACVVTLYERV
jgi:sterol carrier protein 2